MQFTVFTMKLNSVFPVRCAIALIPLIAGLGAIAPELAIAQSLPVSPRLMAQSPRSINGSWRLINMTAPGSPMPMLPLPQVPTADFAGDRLSGSGSCNRYTGDFSTSGSTLSVGPLATTFMSCEPAVMEQEQRFLTALQGAQRYEITDDGFLVISYQTEQGTGVLRFEAAGVRALW